MHDKVCPCFVESPNRRHDAFGLSVLSYGEIILPNSLILVVVVRNKKRVLSVCIRNVRSCDEAMRQMGRGRIPRDGEDEDKEEETHLLLRATRTPLSKLTRGTNIIEGGDVRVPPRMDRLLRLPFATCLASISCDENGCRSRDLRPALRCASARRVRDAVLIYRRLLSATPAETRSADDRIATETRYFEFLFESGAISAPIVIDLCTALGRESSTFWGSIIDRAIRCSEGLSRDVSRAIADATPALDDIVRRAERSDNVEGGENILHGLSVFVATSPSAAKFCAVDPALCERLRTWYDAVVPNYFSKNDMEMKTSIVRIARSIHRAVDSCHVAASIVSLGERDGVCLSKRDDTRGARIDDSTKEDVDDADSYSKELARRIVAIYDTYDDDADDVDASTRAISVEPLQSNINHGDACKTKSESILREADRTERAALAAVAPSKILELQRELDEVNRSSVRATSIRQRIASWKSYLRDAADVDEEREPAPLSSRRTEGPSARKRPSNHPRSTSRHRQKKDRQKASRANHSRKRNAARKRR